MNERRFLAFPIALMLAMAGCSASSGPAQPPPLSGALIGGPFALTGSDGRVVRDSDFAGKYRIMYFGYTSCPDICPTDLQNIGQAMIKLQKSDPKLAAKVVPIFVSVDPERDTPELVGRFAAAFSPSIIGLTGTQAQIDAVTKEYAVVAQKGDKNAEGGYLINHSSQAYLMSPDNKPLALLPADESADAVLSELRRWAH